MSDYPWFPITEQLPVPNALVEVKIMAVFRGKYMPDCKLSKWIMYNGKPIETKPVAWRVIKKR